MTILVVGGNGLIGSGLIRRMVLRGLKVISYSYNQPAQHVDGCIYYMGDVCEYGTINRIYQAHKVDCVIHNAAISSPSLFPENPYKVYRVNVDGLLTSLEAASQNGVERFVYISSDAVYGSDSNGIVTEETPLHLTEPYGSSKAACENILANYGGMRTVALRVGTVYGPNRRVNCPINTLIWDALTKQVAFWNCRDDQQDFIFEDDVVDGIIMVALAENWNYSVYNLGGGHRRTFREIVRILETILPTCKFEEGGTYQPLEFCAELCTERLEKEFKWCRKVSFREGLHRCVENLKTKREA